MNKVLIIMPAYNAAQTLEVTYKNLPLVYDEVVVCDDASMDNTAKVSKRLGLTTVVQSRNKGYGANQKSLFDIAKNHKATTIIMVHPDNQYDTKCLPEIISKIKKGANLVLGSRVKTARLNGMPLWRFLPNRGLTMMQNFVYSAKLSEYHTGLRAYSIGLLEHMPYDKFSDSFVFDSELIAWVLANDYNVAEVDTNCYYNSSISSIKFWPSVIYGLETLKVLVRFRRGYYKKS